MFVEYNNVPLRVVEMPTYTRRNIYTPDNADLLYVEHTMGFVAVYAPAGIPALNSVTALSDATLGTLTGNDPTGVFYAAGTAGMRGFNPGVAAAVMPVPSMEPMEGTTDPRAWRAGPETDAELRYRLLVPRRKLVLWAVDRQSGQFIRWLESPRPGFNVDATTGPLPLSCDVVSVSGQPNSVGVFFQIQTCVSPCPIGSDRLVLSHRWQMTHDHDNDYYLTRIIDGIITFHGGVLDILKLRPDLVRNQLIHPIPMGYRREAPLITQSPDGLSLRYIVRDTNPKIIFGPADSNCTRCELIERVTAVSNYTK